MDVLNVSRPVEPEKKNGGAYRDDAEMKLEFDQMWEALHDLNVGRPVEPEKKNDGAYQDLAVAAQACYKQLWLEQESVLRNDGFVETVASAVARMPLARGFEICTTTTFQLDEMARQTHLQQPFVQAIPQPQFRDTLAKKIRVLFPFLALPSGWINSYGSSPPCVLPLALLFALKKAGVRPRSLLLGLPFCDDMKYWELSLEQLGDVHVIGEQVSDFGLMCQHWISPEGAGFLIEETDDLKPLATFSRTLLCMDRLKTLDVQLSVIGVTGVECPLRDLVTIKPMHPRLQNLLLCGVYLHMSDLEVLLSSVEDPIRIVLDYSVLYTGTWTEVLDMLHGKGTGGSSCMLIKGGENLSMTIRLQDDIFGGHPNFGGRPDYGGANWASQCIMGFRINPLRRADGSPVVDTTDM